MLHFVWNCTLILYLFAIIDVVIQQTAYYFVVEWVVCFVSSCPSHIAQGRAQQSKLCWGEIPGESCPPSVPTSGEHQQQGRSSAETQPKTNLVHFGGCHRSGWWRGVVCNPFRMKWSYSTPGLVSTVMGDCLRAGKPSRCEACQLGRLSLLPCVGW